MAVVRCEEGRRQRWHAGGGLNVGAGEAVLCVIAGPVLANDDDDTDDDDVARISGSAPARCARQLARAGVQGVCVNDNDCVRHE